MPAAAASSWSPGDVDEGHVVPGHRRHLGDPGAHLACADDADPVAHAPNDLEHGRVALGGAGADRGDADPAAAAAQLVDERAEQARARRADRMAERDRAAVARSPARGRSRAGRPCCRATEQKASFTSSRSMSATDIPAFSSATFVARRGRAHEVGEVVGHVARPSG